jgi:hypothetical protein
VFIRIFTIVSLEELGSIKLPLNDARYIHFSLISVVIVAIILSSVYDSLHIELGKVSAITVMILHRHFFSYFLFYLTG